MRIRLHNYQDKCFVSTFGEPVSIEPYGEIFAVHHKLGPGDIFLAGVFSVSHIDTGCHVATGDSIEDAIERAKERIKLKAKTPEDLERAIAKAREIQAADIP